MNGLVGYDLAGNKSLATLGVTTYVIGSALATMPASLWMARVGRRAGFMAGALVNVGGCVLAVLALHERSFALFCVATAMIGRLQRDRPAVSVRRRRSRHARRSRQGDLVGARRRHRGRRRRAGVDARREGLVRDAVRRLVRRARGLRAGRAGGAVARERASTGDRGSCRRASVVGDRAPAGVRRRRAVRRARLRDHEPPDDRDADRDGFLRPPVRAGGLRHRVACGRDVRPGAVHGYR